MDYQTTPQLELAAEFVQYTNQHIFLTGKAGTGKTTFLKNLRSRSPKRMVVVAPTGVAAINAGGVTIHSFFQISFGPQLPTKANERAEIDSNGKVSADVKRFNREKINIIRSIDLLVIDEISMVRADLLDAIDGVLRRFRDRNKPFGGVQLLMIGDLQQLAPIVKEDEWALLSSYYDTAFFFSSRALQKAGFTSIELRQIFRQRDDEFVQLLNQVRENKLTEETLSKLNSRYMPDFNPADDEGYIVLTTHNYQSQKINQDKLNDLSSRMFSYTASVFDEFPEYLYPTDYELHLKVGAQVMFIKNDSTVDKLYYNGKIGNIVAIDDEMIEVKCPEDQQSITVERVEWQNAKYKLNEATQEIEENVVGKFLQFPLKLAWAITIHKSQGLTFEKAIIDARQSFAHGQVYVALSRCKTLSGMVLRTPIEARSVKNDNTVLGFSKDVEAQQPNREQLMQAQKQFQLQLLNELVDFTYLLNQIKYALKEINENESILAGNLGSNLRAMVLPLQADIVDVGVKFQRQIINLTNGIDLLEQNAVFQERMQKAAIYFLEKLATKVLVPFQNSSFSTDNKAVKKNLNTILDKIDKELDVKTSCLKEIRNGFELKNFLRTKSMAQIEQPLKHSSFKAGMVTLDVKYPALYNELNRWRTNSAITHGVAVARIISQKTLLDIANRLPLTIAELKTVKGLGGVKLQKFGKDVLSIIHEFCRQEGLDAPMDIEQELENVALSTFELSLKLFEEGKTIREIAKERNLAVSTIEGHLARFVGENRLKLEQIVNPDRIDAIRRLHLENPKLSTNEIRGKLGEDYSYNEIRLVLSQLN